MTNKRGYDRLAVEGTVDLKCGEHLYRGKLRDICFAGFAGFSAVMHGKIDPGSSVEFNMDISSINDTLEGKGIIRHIKEAVIAKEKIIILGIEFTDVNKDIVGHILKKIQARAIEGQRGKRPFGPIDFIPY